VSLCYYNIYFYVLFNSVHVYSQIRELIKTRESSPALNELTGLLKELRDDEMDHLETAVEWDSKKAPLYDPFTGVVKVGCKAAIVVASRV
jgi:3-demethoxyubiquinol 3-hydroxylase